MTTSSTIFTKQIVVNQWPVLDIGQPPPVFNGENVAVFSFFSSSALVVSASVCWWWWGGEGGDRQPAVKWLKPWPGSLTENFPPEQFVADRGVGHWACKTERKINIEISAYVPRSGQSVGRIEIFCWKQTISPTLVWSALIWQAGKDCYSGY